MGAVCQPTKRICPHTNNVWSGYVLTPIPGHPFTSVSASWIQRPATCPSPNAWALFWVGLDGWSSFGSQTVEQGGTSAQCVGGKPQYDVWWEMFPTNSVQLAFPIAVGDQINASVVFSSPDSTYTITVDDVTPPKKSLVVVSDISANTYTVTVNGVTTGPTSYSPSTVCSVGMPCQNTSAEWVVEAPGGNGSPGTLYPLARFKPVTFTSAAAQNDQGHQGSISDTAWQATALDLTTTAGKYLASVGQLKRAGTAFRDVRNGG
jgi:hypothetical protein